MSGRGEELERADADVIFVFGAGTSTSSDDIDDSLGRLADSSLWAQLDGVQAGQVHVVDPLAWQQGGLRAAERVLDDIEQALS